MANATPHYTPEDLAYYCENYGNTEWMVHVIGPDDVIRFERVDADGMVTYVPFTENTARNYAASVNDLAAHIERVDPSPLNPCLHAVVFHRGVPVDAPAVAK